MDIMSLVFFFLIIVPSSIIHEYAHGWMAYRLGDPTAKHAGRLTLNPIAHIDFFGTILMPILLMWASKGSFLFAYAKPVPYNPYNLRGGKWGPALVGAAGPLSNLALAFAFALVIRALPVTQLTTLLSMIVYANILLAVFNLVPIPPLDGSKVLFAILPEHLRGLRMVLEQYGIMLMFIFIFFFFRLIQPVVFAIYNAFLGGVPGVY
ncbi:MAG: site-2 protease family protein [Candidatus Magasanikbacteria bacterium]|nr:site-2 protease family protein [Candidatus Magasanikbacteria bacterium]